MGIVVEKKKILFVAEDVTMAHFIRPLFLASGLDKDKYEIFLASSGKYEKFAEEFDIELVRLKTIQYEKFFRRSSLVAPLYKKKELFKYHIEEKELIEKIKPDLIVGDFRHSLASTAEILRTPFIPILDDHFIPESKCKIAIPNHFLISVFGRKIIERNIHKFAHFFEYWHLWHLNAYRKKIGLKKIDTLRDFYVLGDGVCIPSIESFREKTGIRTNYNYIGPILWEPKADLKDFEFLEEIFQKRKIIYISMGSSGKGEILEKILKVIAQMPLIAVVGSSGKMIPGKRDNIFVFDFVPALQVLNFCSLAIGNGGSPMVYQSFSKGVPYLGIPTNIDQCFVMQDVIKSGAGENINLEEASEEKIREMIEKILVKERYRKSAERLREEIIKTDSVGKFSEIIEIILNKK